MGEFLLNPQTLAEARLAESHRQLRLETLQLMYVETANERKRGDKWKEEAAKSTWLWLKAAEHLPPDVVEQILLDSRVIKDIDPEFSFCKAISKE